MDDEAGPQGLPEHGPELHRALAAATAGIDEVEDRLSRLFARTEETARPGAPGEPAAPPSGLDFGDDIVELPDEEPVHDEPEHHQRHPPARRLFRRRS